MIDKSEQSALTEAVYFILLSMLEPRHGYSVMQYIGRLTKGRVILGAGTLYGAINTLLGKQWIQTVCKDKSTRKKEYIITELGKQILNDELTRLEELLIIGKNELEGERS